jgi:hypothetical protein
VSGITKKLMSTAGAKGIKVSDLFSTNLYTGNGSTQSVTNGVDLSGEGGMVWIKSRTASTNHQVFDTNRGATNVLVTNDTVGPSTVAGTLTSFNSDGFSLGNNANVNTSSANYVGWTFRKQPRFFDVVSYTGTGANRTIAHNLEVAPGVIIIKSLGSGFENWVVFHKDIDSNPANFRVFLNLVSEKLSSNLTFNNTAPTDSVFSLGIDSAVNFSGRDYIAYLFAHDDETESLIKCGSYTGNGSATGPSISLGWEPQWVLIKRVDGAGGAGGGNWFLLNAERGGSAYLWANTAGTEQSSLILQTTSTGFDIKTTLAEINASGGLMTFIAIRSEDS